MAAASNGASTPLNLAYMTLPTSPLRALEGPSVVAQGVPEETAGTIDPGLGGLAAIRTGPQPGLRLRLARRIVQVDGASGLPRPYEVALGAAGIPRPTVPRRMASEANGLGSRPTAQSPTVASASSDTVGGAGLVLVTKVTAPAVPSRKTVAALVA